jgi:transcriptional regulator of acetoin/glycerol metabolism
LAAVVRTGDAPEVVRHEIGASWQRSVRSGLNPNQFAVFHDPDLETDGLLARAARPVLDQLADDLAPTRMSVVLTDRRAHLLDRRVAERSLRNQLDDISLAPGFGYAEDEVGTNAIGTALEQRRPSVVQAEEHFADALTTMACAAAPVIDPRNGRILGAIDLTCWAPDATPLMLPLVARAAREIEERLVDGARVSERVLLQQFLRERRRAKGPFVLISERTMITNTAADRIVDAADAAILWDCARQLIAGHAGSPELVLSSGASVMVRCEPVVDGGVLRGALLSLRPPSAEGASASRRPAGWDLTSTERSVTELVAQGLTNRQVAERLFVSRYTVDAYLRSIFRKLQVSSRVDLTRLALEELANSKSFVGGMWTS